MKQCACCKEVKPFTEFCKNAKRKGGYHYYCKTCHSASNKKWRDANREAALATSAAYREANREKCHAASKAWEKANPEKIKAWRKRYSQEKSAYLQDKCVRYRANKANRTPAWLTESDWLQIQCKYQVAAMYNREGLDRWDVDHIIPLHGKRVSGLHVPSNLRVIKSEENKRKANKYVVE
jgi:hypothetical protein